MTKQKREAATTLQAKFISRRTGSPVQRAAPSKRGFWLLVFGGGVIGLYLLLSNMALSSKEAAVQPIAAQPCCQAQTIAQNPQPSPTEQSIQAAPSKKLK